MVPTPLSSEGQLGVFDIEHKTLMTSILIKFSSLDDLHLNLRRWSVRILRYRRGKTLVLQLHFLHVVETNSEKEEQMRTIFDDN